MARQEGDKEVKKRLFQRMSLLIQKGNAALFNNRMPDDPYDANFFM